MPDEIETALRVARLGVLDLEHVGAPFREHRACGWNERPARDLDDPNALHWTHAWLPSIHGVGDTLQSGPSDTPCHHGPEISPRVPSSSTLRRCRNGSRTPSGSRRP